MNLVYRQVNIVVARVMLLIYVLLLSEQGHSNDLRLEDGKVHYTFEIMKHMRWPNEDSLEALELAVISSDNALIDAFRERDNEIVRGKKVQIHFFKRDSFNISPSLIFIGNKKRSLNSKLFSKWKNSLIITDGKVSKEEQMISLIPLPRSIRIRLNRDNLVERGFSPSTTLLNLAGTKEDLSQHLLYKEQMLLNLAEDVEQSRQQLLELNKQLQQKSKDLNNAQGNLEKNQKALKGYQVQLRTLTSHVQRAKEEVQSNEQALQQQAEKLKSTQSEILNKEQEMQQLLEDISSNKTILDQQHQQISQQHDIIESKDKTIDSQRSWLYLILSVAVTLLLMSYFLLRLNHLRKTANQELEKLNNQLYELATQDSMTQLYNRRHFLERSVNEFNKLLRTKKSACMMMLDIDHFKKVNDTYGHDAGDKVIIEVANIMKQQVREYDLIGRLGGEEFAIMLIECEIEQAKNIAERLCQEVAQQIIAHENNKIKITISVGLIEIKPEDKNIEHAITRADKALYEAKESGRNRVILQ